MLGLQEPLTINIGCNSMNSPVTLEDFKKRITLYNFGANDNIIEWSIQIEELHRLSIVRISYGDKDRAVVQKEHKFEGEDHVLEAYDDALKRYEHKRNRGRYTHSIPQKRPFSPMLVGRYEHHHQNLPDINHVQIKYDGHRATMFKGRLETRKQETYTGLPHLAHISEQLEDHEILDGELWIPGLHRDRIAEITRCKEFHIRHEEVIFVVFDIVLENTPFSIRSDIYPEIVSRLNSEHVQAAPTFLKRKDQLEASFQKAVQSGHEGIIIRTPDSQYEIGKRSVDTLKRKPFETDYFKIISIVDKPRSKGIAVLGLATETGIEFKASIKGTQQYRKYIYDNMQKYIGGYAKVKYPCESATGTPQQCVAEEIYEK